jgi:hypothetical protein
MDERTFYNFNKYLIYFGVERGHSLKVLKESAISKKLIPTSKWMLKTENKEIKMILKSKLEFMKFKYK